MCCRRREGAAGLEDGTAHYLGIAALKHGFQQLHTLGGFPAIAAHTQAVTRHAFTPLSCCSCYAKAEHAAPLLANVVCSLLLLFHWASLESLDSVPAAS